MHCACADTMVFHQVTKVAGLTLKNAACLQDEISTGLDSSTTYQIVKYLRDLTHLQKNTTLISLLQPAPESYELFDDVLLISEGEPPALNTSLQMKTHVTHSVATVVFSPSTQNAPLLTAPLQCYTETQQESSEG